jgi:hypothetical protein
MPTARAGGKMIYLLVIFLSFTAHASGSDNKRVVNFDRDRVGSLAPEWESAMTKTGGAPNWQIMVDETAPSTPNVLAQVSSDRTAGRFPLAVYRGVSFKDGEVSVRFKPVSGTVDQAAGIVWRYLDRDNYYIVRANALENNVVLYKVQGGERTSLAPRGMPSRSYGVKQPVPKRAWSELKVVFDGSVAAVYFNNRKLFDVEDAAFSAAGRIGLWTKADSVTYFDDFTFIAR